jgi:hypothetical protein
MRRAVPVTWVFIVCLIQGCSTIRHRVVEHPGITEANPNAVVREFHATSTQVARTIADVMSEDSIIVNVVMTPDTSSREARNFTKAERQTLGIPPLEPTTDVNYNVSARSRNGHPITVAVRLKGEAGSEVSVLYGTAGDLDLSRDILDKTGARLVTPAKDPAITKASGAKTSAR